MQKHDGALVGAAHPKPRQRGVVEEAAQEGAGIVAGPGVDDVGDGFDVALPAAEDVVGVEGRLEQRRAAGPARAVAEHLAVDVALLRVGPARRAALQRVEGATGGEAHVQDYVRVGVVLHEMWEQVEDVAVRDFDRFRVLDDLDRWARAYCREVRWKC